MFQVILEGSCFLAGCWEIDSNTMLGGNAVRSTHAWGNSQNRCKSVPPWPRYLEYGRSTLHGRGSPWTWHPCSGLDHTIWSPGPDSRVYPQGGTDGKRAKRKRKVICWAQLWFLTAGAPCTLRPSKVVEQHAAKIVHFVQADPKWPICLLFQGAAVFTPGRSGFPAISPGCQGKYLFHVYLLYIITQARCLGPGLDVAVTGVSVVFKVKLTSWMGS